MLKKPCFNRIAYLVCAFEIEIRDCTGRTREHCRGSLHPKEVTKPHVESAGGLIPLLNFLVAFNAFPNASKEVPLNQRASWFSAQFGLDSVITFTGQSIEF